MFHDLMRSQYKVVQDNVFCKFILYKNLPDFRPENWCYECIQMVHFVYRKKLLKKEDGKEMRKIEIVKLKKQKRSKPNKGNQTVLFSLDTVRKCEYF